jgi:hypothetical protein
LLLTAPSEEEKLQMVYDLAAKTRAVYDLIAKNLARNVSVYDLTAIDSRLKSNMLTIRPAENQPDLLLGFDPNRLFAVLVKNTLYKFTYVCLIQANHLT